MKSIKQITLGALTLLLLAASASAASFTFSTGEPDGKIATLSRPASPGKLQTETADDFILTQTTLINQATFAGLLPLGASLRTSARLKSNCITFSQVTRIPTEC